MESVSASVLSTLLQDRSYEDVKQVDGDLVDTVMWSQRVNDVINYLLSLIIGRFGSQLVLIARGLMRMHGLMYIRDFVSGLRFTTPLACQGSQAFRPNRHTHRTFLPQLRG